MNQWDCTYGAYACPFTRNNFQLVFLFQMTSFFERNSKTRSRARLNALKSGKASVQGIQDAIPQSGTMTPQELSEVCIMII